MFFEDYEPEDVESMNEYYHDNPNDYDDFMSRPVTTDDDQYFEGV